MTEKRVIISVSLRAYLHVLSYIGYFIFLNQLHFMNQKITVLHIAECAGGVECYLSSLCEERRAA